MTDATDFWLQMVACNVCVWLSVLIGETKHELELSLSDPYRITPAGFEEYPYPLGLRWNTTNVSAAANVYKKPLHMYAQSATAAMSAVLIDAYPQSCRAQTIIGNILQKVRENILAFTISAFICRKLIQGRNGMSEQLFLLR